jgi:hypothetical protein
MGPISDHFFQTSEILAALAAVFEGYNDEEKAAQLKKVRTAPSCVVPLFPVSWLTHVLEQWHFRVSRQERCGEGSVVDDRLEEDVRGEEGGGQVARAQVGRDDYPVGRHVRRDCGRQDDGAEGVHDGRAQDEGKHDARDEARWRPQGMHRFTSSSLLRRAELMGSFCFCNRARRARRSSENSYAACWSCGR